MGKRLNPVRGKFERLLFLIKALYKHPGLNAEQLARDCQVSTRTIFRDLKVLIRAGISVEASPGYRLASESIFLPLKLSRKSIWLCTGLCRAARLKRTISYLLPAAGFYPKCAPILSRG